MSTPTRPYINPRPFYHRLVLVLVLMLGLLSACSDDDEATVEVRAYFSPDYASTLALDATDTQFPIYVCRTTADRAVSIPLTTDQSLDGESTTCFGMPATATFAAGEDTTCVYITYDVATLGYDTYYQLTLAIPSDYAASTVGAQATFTAYVPTPWQSLGLCMFTEDFLTTFFTFSPATYEVELQVSAVAPGHFRLVNAFGEAYPYSWEGEWDATTDTYLTIHAEDPDGVYIPLQDAGLTLTTYGCVTVGSLAAMYMAEGYTLSEVKALGLTGTYADGVITFPERTLAVRLAGYSEEYYYANNNGAFCVVVPE